VHVQRLREEAAAQLGPEPVYETVPLPLQSTGLSVRMQIQSKVTAHNSLRAAYLTPNPSHPLRIRLGPRVGEEEYSISGQHPFAH
jgi:hypothetical protein